jgi:cobyrinic acid a,c-diamide synthase
LADALIVGAPASGTGKTLVTLALLRALRKSGVSVSSAKVGPDYIDPRFHEAATGGACVNLDQWAMRPHYMENLVQAASHDTDLLGARPPTWPST